MIFGEFRDKWLEMVPRSNGYLSLGLNHPLNLQIGYGTAGYKSFVVMESEAVPEISSSFAIKARNTELSNGTWILEFQLVHVSFEEEFLRLCWDMIESTAKSSSPLQDLILKYISWQKLLQYSSKEVMTFSRQKGLVGELLYLSGLLQKTSGLEAISSWTGPDGSDQDFTFETTWAEIKTIALASSSVKISSMQQLQQESTGSLIVYVLEKTTPGDDRVSLVPLVEQIRALLRNNPITLDRFDMKLFKYGYRESDITEYNKNQFRFIKMMEYTVDNDFPKLCRDNVAQEIISCSYELSLSAIEVYRRP